MRRAGDWVNLFGGLCALAWATGGAQISVGAPPLIPSRERLCALYATPSPRPELSLPAQIGPLAQYGAPYWGTWMPAFTPKEPALSDPYPRCLQDAGLFARVQADHHRAWAQWRGTNALPIIFWALAPLAAVPLLMMAAGLAGRRAKLKPTGSLRIKPSGPVRQPPGAAIGAVAAPARAMAPNAPPLRAQLRKDPTKGAAAPASPGTRNH